MIKVLKISLLILVLTEISFGQQTFDKIEFSNIKQDELYVSGFNLEYERDVYIEVTGEGFEGYEFNSRNIHSDPSSLYAYAWIIDAGTRKMVWRMTDKNCKKSDKNEDNLYTFEGSVSIPAGNYEVYYYGRSISFFQTKSFWSLGRVLKDILIKRDKDAQSHRTQWHLLISGIDGSETKSGVLKELDARKEEAIVSLEANRPHMFRKKIIEVTKTVDANIYAIGEFSSKASHDHGWIRKVDTREKVWEMKPGKGSSAGGAVKNQVYRTDLRLKPGTYEVAYLTDDSHQLNKWNSNPPMDPFFYGLTLVVSPNQMQYVKAGISGSEKILAEITRVGADVNEVENFELDKPSRVKVIALGEGDDGEMFDYGWISDHQGNTIWMMNYYMTVYGGGASKNRRASEVLVLEAGEYSVHFITDDSHNWGDWNQAPPEEESDYGILVFYLEETTKSEIKEATKHNSNILVDLTMARSNSVLKKNFSLDKETTIIIYAVGEGSRGKMYDYGWIESMETRDKIWEMDYDSTTPAGGSKKNRMTKEKITLPAGEYRVYFVADDSHAFGDWNAKPPIKAESWGIKITKKD